jgi:ERCC4-type nuclease
MLVSPTERPPLNQLGKVSSLPEKFGCDFMVVARGRRFGVQRKAFPQDLTSSLHDGRLYQQVNQMVALDKAIVILEGFGTWTDDGVLIDRAHFTKDQLHGLIWSLSVEHNIEVFQVASMKETIGLLTSLESWAEKERHGSLRSRPNPKRNSWGKVDDAAFGSHIWQSFPGVGPELAGRMYGELGLPLKWTITLEDLLKVRGIGKEKAKRMIGALGDSDGT